MNRSPLPRSLAPYSQAVYVARPWLLSRRLMPWYEAHRRVLPWRSRPTLYRVWISEVMLQQTQVATVIPYFEQFVRQFPNVRSLAAAPLADVLRRWEGLGYYRRARLLHQAARVIVEQHRGRLPRTRDAWQALPGIGRYTANAIVSIALNHRQPILEGNTRRLYARLLGMHDDPSAPDSQRTLWDFAQHILPNDRCGPFNQALMELGATVCHVAQPDCGVCPLRKNCPTRENGWQSRIPVRPTKRVRYEHLREAIVVIKRRSKWLVRLCGPQERWSGLWDLPRYDASHLSEAADEALVDYLTGRVLDATGLSVSLARHGPPIQHAVTRYRIQLECFSATHVNGRLRRSNRDGAKWKWVAPSELDALALNVTARRVVQRSVETP